MKSIHSLPYPLLTLALAGLGSLSVTSALAQEGGYYYGGLAIGQSRAKLDEQRIAADQLGAGVTTTTIATDKRDTGYKLFGGYQINRNLALEAGYFSLGRFGLTSTTTPAGTLAAQFKVQGLNLDLVGGIPISERFSVLGRVGAQLARTSDNFSGTGAVVVTTPNPSKRETNLKLGAGLQYAVSPSFLVRTELEHYRLNDAVGQHIGANLISVSLVFPFGRSAGPAPRAMATPSGYSTAALVTTTPRQTAPTAYVASTVVAEPAVVPVAYIAPPRQKVSFSAESLFTFDQSTLRPEGKSALDNFAKELIGTDFDLITVEGHTDRLGSQEYNQKLALQRADAVKSYLVDSARIESSKITVLSKSENDPVTKPGDCKGNQANAKLIACLQPDRRVEIEVTASR
jgi:OOP family OmpA-OmpF porin